MVYFDHDRQQHLIALEDNGLEGLKEILVSLSLAEHAGDVNDDLPRLCKVLGFPEPAWSSRWMRMVFPWEDDRWKDRDNG